jgi:3-hydroxyisobutyrate dehydrogenase-like beta-hydroxyacid dehydrogenase
MGAALGALMREAGHQVYWVSEGRSSATIDRANRAGLRDAGSVANLCAECSMIISVGPAQAAETIAEQVAALGFTGLYLEANAIAPQKALRMSRLLTQAGATFVDGSILGAPEFETDGTCLFLSGPAAEQVAECFPPGPLQTRVIGAAIGQASALKLCASAYTKASATLLCTSLAGAEKWRVLPALEQHWVETEPHLASQIDPRPRGVSLKAWRFESEMQEIATMLRDAGIPAELYAGAATVFRRLAHFKDASETPALLDVLAAVSDSK